MAPTIPPSPHSRSETETTRPRMTNVVGDSAPHAAWLIHVVGGPGGGALSHGACAIHVVGGPGGGALSHGACAIHVVGGPGGVAPPPAAGTFNGLARPAAVT